ncbi:hypothetical protein SAMN02949497_3448 [Methylomagnum ishizawai]|uniref:Uncharacterized protein n=1 Tax=Methylomagnum ishizawai TaxID=1760988 RepID=A0A1Y6D0A7_9GAMM|nr:hypothetical protein [Methylomagnum ishizawai]SMF96067.1 hypothetical protein SAMN02949497_3448 [Methylomagnum ishizawai]
MARPHKAKSELRDYSVRVNFTASEYAELEAKAKAAKLPLALYLYQKIGLLADASSQKEAA